MVFLEIPISFSTLITESFNWNIPLSYKRSTITLFLLEGKMVLSDNTFVLSSSNVEAIRSSGFWVYVSIAAKPLPLLFGI